MRARQLAVTAALVTVLPMASGLTARPAVAAEEPGSYSAAQVELGRKLVSFGGCNDCHTPWAFDAEIGAPVPDMSRLLSGHPEGAAVPGGSLGEGDMAVIGPTFTSFLMPFGVVYSANLTPDVDTGTGSWTEEMFVGIFRKAKHLGGNGRPVLPPMPWPMAATLPDADLIAIYAYLRSIPPIRNDVPVAQPPEEVQATIDASNQKILARMREPR